MLRRSGRPFPWLVLTLALPALAAGCYLAWLWSTGASPLLPLATRQSVASSSTEAEGQPQPSDWRQMLDAAGVDPSAIEERNGALEVEFAGGPQDLVARLEENGITDVARDGETITIASNHDSVVVRVRPLPVQNSGLGLVEAAGGGGQIVLILDDVGFERQPLERAAAIDPDIAFAVIPSASRALASADWLSARGFELLCHLPMEPRGWPAVRVDEPAILVGMDDATIRSTTADLVARVPGIAGVNNHMGSRASSDQRVMRGVMEVVRDRGLYFIDSRTASSSVGEKTARELGVRSASRQVFLDDDPSPAAIRRQLAELVKLARRDGVAVGIGHVVPGTVAVLEDEIPRLREAGIRLVRPSRVVH